MQLKKIIIVLNCIFISNCYAMENENNTIEKARQEICNYFQCDSSISNEELKKIHQEYQKALQQKVTKLNKVDDSWFVSIDFSDGTPSKILLPQKNCLDYELLQAVAKKMIKQYEDEKNKVDLLFQKALLN